MDRVDTVVVVDRVDRVVVMGRVDKVVVVDGVDKVVVVDRVDRVVVVGREDEVVSVDRVDKVASVDRVDRPAAVDAEKTTTADVDCCLTRCVHQGGVRGSQRICHKPPVSSVIVAPYYHLPGQFCCLVRTRADPL